MSNTDSKKRKRIVPALDNPIEAVRDVAASMAHDAASVPSDLAENAFRQIFGTPAKNGSGELNENQTLEFDEIEKRNEILSFQKQRQTIEKDVFSYQENEALKKEIESLLKELKLLANSTKELTKEIESAAMEEMPVNPGTYHVNFIEWLISMVKSLRERVEDSQTWLGVFTSKKKQKGYWSMFKKHGTSFGLSNERVVATQTG
ncbi:MAG: DUF5660 domain-containing protein [Patescibacteria group bacterium]|nr:DUF5660 domain-containing protein [Patescibacteria group bacterium]